jgi:hypothetical protein
VVGAHNISMMDGYSKYNKIEVLKEDKENIPFTTQWGAFMYDKIPFGLSTSSIIFIFLWVDDCSEAIVVKVVEL